VLSALRYSCDSHPDESDLKSGSRVEYREFGHFDARDLDAKFFPQLPLSRVGVGLAGLAFPAGKLPESPVALVGWPLADEKPFAVSDYRRDYSNHTVIHAGKLAQGAPPIQTPAHTPSNRGA
jgi:hypothetical protein